LARWNLLAKEYFLITIHRAENTDNVERLQDILQLLLELRAPAIFPMHPRVKNLLAVNRKLRPLRWRLEAQPNLRLAPPVSYFEMLALEKNARAIITDSGGVQKEAFFFRVPCITLRNETEWVETLDGGFNTLVGANRKKFLAAIAKLDKTPSRVPGRKSSRLKGLHLFVGGKASQRIVRILRRALQKNHAGNE
jgi:UDP-N-acetylglucosamine 2-epimerase